MHTKFIKMHGLGNDFVILDHRDGQMRITPEQARYLANRKEGVGCDQIIIIEAISDSKADMFMHIMNADGSEAGACGNATRCIAYLFMEETGADHCMIETISGFLNCERAGADHIKVDMGAPKLDWKDIPLSQEQDTVSLDLSVESYKDPVAVNVGNPHCVFFVEDAENVPLAQIGPQIENHPLFPERTNVEFVTILSEKKLRMRVWERGSGITKSCGTGACASFVAARQLGFVSAKVDVVLDGGILSFEERSKDGHIIMTGPVAYVFEGKVAI